MISLSVLIKQLLANNRKNYRDGTTLQKLQHDLLPYSCQLLSPTKMCIKLSDGPKIMVCEQVKTLFLAHVITHQFSLTGLIQSTSHLNLNFVISGLLRRRKVIYHLASSQVDTINLIATIKCYPQIEETLLKLDFLRLQLMIIPGHWQLVLEHYMASEVISRLPIGRYYVRLSPEQRVLLLSTFLMFSQLMERLEVINTFDKHKKVTNNQLDQLRKTEHLI